MIFDGICLRKIVAELRTALIGGKLNKVLVPSKNELLLRSRIVAMSFCEPRS